MPLYQADRLQGKGSYCDAKPRCQLLSRTRQAGGMAHAYGFYVGKGNGIEAGELQ